MKGQQIDGVDVDVSLAKPQVENKQRRAKAAPAQKRNQMGGRSSGNRAPPSGPFGDYYSGPVGRGGGGRGGGAGGYGAPKFPSYPNAGYGGYTADPYAGGYGAPYQAAPYGGYDPYSYGAPDPYYSGPYNGPARGGGGVGGPGGVIFSMCFG